MTIINRDHRSTCNSVISSACNAVISAVFHSNSVSLEPPADTDEDDEITARSFLDPFDPGPFEFGSTSRILGTQRREREERKGGGKVIHGSKVGAVTFYIQVYTSTAKIAANVLSVCT